MITVFVQKINPRVLYSFKLLFTSILGVQTRVVSCMADFEKAQGAKVNYSVLPAEGLTIFPDDLLFETGIRIFEPAVIIENGVNCLFPTKEGSMLSFDPFAASFYMVSRYEEYLDQPLDNHGRMMASASFAFKNNFLDKPVVDKWAYMLKAILQKMYPDLIFSERRFRHIPTIDIDIAYAYQHHGWVRGMLGTIKIILTGNLKDLKLRFKTLVLHEKDPYDVFDQLSAWYTKFRLRPVFFFLVGDYGQYDRNISPGHAAMQQLIHHLGRKYSIGIHPSYASNYDYAKLKQEVHVLEKIKGKKVIRSRQHFLKLTIPSTYQWLMGCNIEKDYSMGYAASPGFRAGTCTPFLFYDISTERETSLTIYPFQVMDGTFIDYMQVSPAEAILKIKEIIERIREVDGTFISLWHNVSLSEISVWKNWSKVYVQLLEDSY